MNHFEHLKMEREVTYHFDKDSNVLWEVSTPVLKEEEKEEFTLKEINPGILRTISFAIIFLLVTIMIWFLPV